MDGGLAVLGGSSMQFTTETVSEGEVQEDLAR